MKDRPRRSRTAFAFGVRLEVKGDMNDAVVEGSALASNRRGLEDPEHPPVVDERIRAEPTDALMRGVAREMLKEECRQPATLVRVGDRERDLELVTARKSECVTSLSVNARRAPRRSPTPTGSWGLCSWHTGGIHRGSARSQWPEDKVTSDAGRSTEASRLGPERRQHHVGTNGGRR